jgi:hypothetical protein
MKKVFLRSLLLFSVAYVILYLLTTLPGSQKVLADAYKSMANTVVVPALPKAYLLFEQQPEIPDDPKRIRARLDSQAKVDAQMQAAREQGLKTLDLKFPTYNIALFEFFIFPLLFFLALLIATPVPWKRKLAASAIGLLLLLIFMFFKTYFITLYHLQRNQIAEYQMSEFWEGLIGKVQVGFNNITTALIVATLIWAVTVFKKSDWKKFSDQLNQATAKNKAPERSK